ncbi:hypothetical protein I3760_15G053600 [Carya illinoinensis]|nr:hypothetical protein I3760_15G053600 [Carya illinoinensis]
MSTIDHRDYVLLKAEEASFLDLVCFLLSTSTSAQATRFIEFSKPYKKDVQKVEIRKRWYICVSIFLQKLLIIFGTPMALSREMLEWLLNLLSSNGGFFKLWLTIISGKQVVVLNKSSATFTSVVGHLDQRVKLDKNIKPTNDKKYKKSLSMMACKLSYENEAFVQTIIKKSMESYVEEASTQAIMFKDTSSNPNLIMVAFTGTKPFDSFGWQTYLDLLGGALAILFVTVLAKHEEAWLLEKLEGLGEYMKEKMEKYDVKYFRYVYSNDLVPRIPYDNGDSFQHFKTSIYYSRCYHEYLFKEEPNENYFSLLWAIPKYQNAFWELIRSFIIPWTRGPDYGETLLMRMFRVFGLLIPGVPADLTQDYVNATRLGPKL